MTVQVGYSVKTFERSERENPDEKQGVRTALGENCNLKQGTKTRKARETVPRNHNADWRIRKYRHR